MFFLNLCLAVKYVGSFPVDDRCLDDQMEQLHTQLKALKVSPEVAQTLLQNKRGNNPFLFDGGEKNVDCLQSDMQKEEACIHKVLHQRGENV